MKIVSLMLGIALMATGWVSNANAKSGGAVTALSPAQVKQLKKQAQCDQTVKGQSCGHKIQ